MKMYPFMKSSDYICSRLCGKKHFHSVKWLPQIEFFMKALMDIKSNLKDTEPKYSGKSGMIFCLWCTVSLLSHLKGANVKLNRQDFLKEWGNTVDIRSPKGTIDYLTCLSGCGSFLGGFTGSFMPVFQSFVLAHKFWKICGVSWMSNVFFILPGGIMHDNPLYIQLSHTFWFVSETMCVKKY